MRASTAVSGSSIVAEQRVELVGARGLAHERREQPRRRAATSPRPRARALVGRARRRGCAFAPRPASSSQCGRARPRAALRALRDAARRRGIEQEAGELDVERGQSARSRAALAEAAPAARFVLAREPRPRVGPEQRRERVGHGFAPASCAMRDQARVTERHVRARDRRREPPNARPTGASAQRALAGADRHEHHGVARGELRRTSARECSRRRGARRRDASRTAAGVADGRGARAAALAAPSSSASSRMKLERAEELAQPLAIGLAHGERVRSRAAAATSSRSVASRFESRACVGLRLQRLARALGLHLAGAWRAGSRASPYSLDQLGGALLADPLHAGNVVGRVADQRAQIEQLLGRHAEALLDFGGPVAAVLHRVEQRDALADELHQVLVGRDDRDAPRRPARARPASRSRRRPRQPGTSSTGSGRRRSARARRGSCARRSSGCASRVAL